ncbi:MAG: class B sortase, partial [Eubacteriales bacterium]|nr:class B sortase [Eubacteriales bacterium]
MKKYKRLLLITFVCIGLLLTLSLYQYSQRMNEDVYIRLAEEYEIPEEEAAKDRGSAEEIVEKVEIPIDFAALQQENPDIY